MAAENKPKLDLKFLREKMPGFEEMERVNLLTRADEKLYKTNPGYKHAANHSFGVGLRLADNL
ncbi:MAG: hypothetical protein KGL39_11815 [Patescibacteria group bacterium]|nr:hypothetical protein [Patescibacteria group bacterium]